MTTFYRVNEESYESNSNAVEVEPRQEVHQSTINHNMQYNAKVTINSDGMSSESGSKINSVDARELDNGYTGLLGTAKHGGLPTSKLTPSTTVTYQGQEVTLEVAERIGLITRDANGNYHEVNQEALARSKQEYVPEKVPQPSISDESIEGINSAIDNMGEQIFTANLESLINSRVHGNTDSKFDLQSFADHAGVPVEQFSERMEGIIKDFERQAERHLNKRGVNGADCLRYARDGHIPRELILNAIRAQLYGDDLSGYDEMADYYLNHSYPTELPEGVTMRELNGETLVKIEGYPEMSIRTAVKMGIL